MLVRIHSVLEYTSVNGPGERSGVWFQGCSIRCAGCWNPDTFESESGKQYDTVELADYLTSLSTDGVTLSGGEPLDQLEACLELAERIRLSGKSVILFSGYSFTQLMRKVSVEVLKKSFDSVVMGGFRETSELGKDRRFSHKTLRHFSDRYCDEDFLKVPSCEAIISDGQIVWTGLDVPHLSLRERNSLLHSEKTT